MTFFVIIVTLIGQNYISKELPDAGGSSVGVLGKSLEESLAEASSIRELYKQDSLSLSKKLFEESELVENKLILIVRDNNDYINPRLANKYLKWGIAELKRGEIEKGTRALFFAGKLDPSNRRIPLVLVKLNFPNLFKMAEYLWSYFLTFKFLNNKVFLIKSLILFLILLSFWILLSIIVASIVYSLSYITKWIQKAIKVSGLWIAAILFAMFVWLPLQYIFIILVAIALLKMNKTDLIKCASILIILSVLVSYSYIISNNYNPNSSFFREFKSRFNPRDYGFDYPVTPYGYSTKGIEHAKKGDLSGAIDFFEKGYKLRRDINYLENLCSVHYAREDTAKVLNLCESILSYQPKNEIANITIIKIFLNGLNFDEATRYIEKSGVRLFETAEKEPPIYRYPPEKWLYKYIFVPRGIFRYFINNKLYLMVLIAICLMFMGGFKKEKDSYCPICKGFMLTDRTDDKMCISCASKLLLTKSKSIRERLKRHIVRKAMGIDRMNTMLMSIMVPGSAHFYKKRYFEGLSISFFVAIFILIFLFSVLYQPEKTLQYRISIGNNTFKVSLVLFYLLLMYSSWRLEPYGNGR
jgi:tetratricopeptide (TPR) repeat protein